MRHLVFLSMFLVATCNTTFSAFAWSDLGHRVICQIAYEELKPDIKARVDALIAINAKFRTFADGCTWPDVFPRQRPPEHYVDLPRSAKGIEVERPCPVAYRCVISAILNDTRDLALSLDVSDQLSLLKSLGHWVGDVHQPLHVSFDDDRGGNLVAVAGSCWLNLHAAWDACIIEKRIGLDYTDVAGKLRAEITDEDRKRWIPPVVDTAAVVGWANKSSAIAEIPDVQYCVKKDDACWYASDQQGYSGGIQRVVTIDDAYLTAQAATVRQQLKMAGVRLGAILNTALSGRDKEIAAGELHAPTTADYRTHAQHVIGFPT